MKRVLLALVIVFYLQGDELSEGRAIESLATEIPAYRFVYTITGRFPEQAEEQRAVQQVFIGLDWLRFDSNPGDLDPPKLVRGGIYLLQPAVLGSRGRGSSGRRFLANIDPLEDTWKSFEMAYRVAVDHTGDIPKIGTIEVNYFVDRPTSYFIRGLHDAALTAVHIMGLFRRELIDTRSILLGTLEPDGRIGPVFGMLSDKMAMLIPIAEQILIPSGQLVTLDSTVMHQLQQHGTKVLEVDNIEQAYQLMVRTR